MDELFAAACPLGGVVCHLFYAAGFMVIGMWFGWIIMVCLLQVITWIANDE